MNECLGFRKPCREQSMACRGKHHRVLLIPPFDGRVPEDLGPNGVHGFVSTSREALNPIRQVLFVDVAGSTVTGKGCGKQDARRGSAEISDEAVRTPVRKVLRNLQTHREVKRAIESYRCRQI